MTTTLYSSLSAWVEDYLSVIYSRRLGTRHVWCPHWWDHPEAVVRLEAMWRAWEHMRKSDAALGIAAWFTEVADPMMRELLDPDGPFKGCDPERHRPKPETDMTLPVIPPPPSLAGV